MVEEYEKINKELRAKERQMKGVLRKPNQIHSLKVGKNVIMLTDADKEYHGVFCGLSNDKQNIILETNNGKASMGLPLTNLLGYIECEI